MQFPTFPKAGASPIQITIAEKGLCPYYVGCYIKNVDNKAPSPEWLVRRLTSIGENSISILVDITNYFTFSYGRPMHVYDADELPSSLTLRQARKGESVKALDGKNYALTPPMVVIASEEEIFSIAGIIGAEKASCQKHTRNIWLEIAYFDPISIAYTGRELQLITHARYRFERHVDPLFLEPAAALVSCHDKHFMRW